MSVSKDLNTTDGKNRFRFVSFRERIENLSFDVVHQIDRKPIELSETNSYFNYHLEQLIEVNLTTHFVNYYHEIKGKVQSLPQLLYHKDVVINTLKEAIDNSDDLSLEPLLKLVAPLARDLQDEFYDRFLDLYKSLEALLHHKDAKIIEWAFNAISYSFKYLAKKIVTDLPTTFRMISPLLKEKEGRSYLRQFASESFGFLVRKAKKGALETIIGIILTYYNDDPTPDLLLGICSLLLESMKNVDTMLHSKSELIIQTIFTFIFDVELDLEHKTLNEASSYYQIADTLIHDICHHCRKQNIHPLFNQIRKLIDWVTEIESDQDQITTFKRYTLLLGICSSYASYYHGVCVLDVGLFHNLIINASKNLLATEVVNNVPLMLLNQLFKFFVVLSQQATGKVLTDLASSVITNVFNSKVIDVKLICDFSLLLLHTDFIHFGQLVLPKLVTLMNDHWDEYQQLFSIILVEINHKNILIQTGSTVKCVTSDFKLNFESEVPVQTTIQILDTFKDWVFEIDQVDQLDVSMETEVSRIAYYTNLLTVLSLLEVKVDKVAPVLLKLYQKLLKFVEGFEGQSNLNSAETKRLVIGEVLLGYTIETLVKIYGNGSGASDSTKATKKRKVNKDKAKFISEHCKEMVEFWQKQVVPILLPKFSSSKPIIRAINKLVESLNRNTNPDIETLFSLEQLKLVYSHLHLSLRSYDEELRVLSFEILSHFDLGTLKEQSNHVTDLFPMCLQVDRIPTTLQSYREKLIPIRKLGVLDGNGQIPYFDTVVPGLALALLTVNLKPLWSEAVKVIKASAGKHPKILSKMLVELLEQLTSNQFTRNYDRIKLTATILTDLIDDSDKKVELDDYLENLLKDRQTCTVSLSYSTTNLLRRLSPRQDRLDKWNVYDHILKVLVELPGLATNQSSRLIDLFMDLYQRYQNQNDDTVLLVEADDDTNKPAAEEFSFPDEATETNEKVETSSYHVAQPIRNHLHKLLQVFAKFSNASKLPRRAELEPIYETLLCNGDNDIQDASLKCLEQYNYPFLTQYADRLHNLLDEVKFRDEVTTFTITKDSDVLDSAHRTQLLPYLVKVLFGRLVSKKGRKSNRNNIVARRITILGYLSGLQPEELTLLFDILLKPYTSLLQDISADSVSNFELNPEIDVDAIPVKKQLGFLYLLTDLFKQMGTRLTIHLPKLLTVLLYFLSNATTKLHHDNPQYRIIRQLATKQLLNAFKVKGEFQFTAFMPTIFEVAVLPRLPNLATENVQSTSATLDMFLVWSKRANYVHYLVDYDSRVLPNLFDCLTTPNVKPPVIQLVLDVVESILSFKDVDNDTTVERKVLVPYVTQLLHNLEFVMVNPISDQLTLRNSLFKRQVTILSKLAIYVSSPEQADKLVALLVPTLQKPDRVLDGFAKRDILTIITQLIPIVPELQSTTPTYYKYYQSLARLFYNLELREAKNTLLTAFQALANVDPELQNIIQVLVDLNAYSKRRLDEPDFELRLNAFTTVHDQLSTGLSAHQWLPLLYISLHCLLNAEEMSLRNGGNFCLTKFMDVILVSESETQVQLTNLIMHIVFPTIKRGIKHKSEVVRDEFVKLLGSLIEHFPTLEPFNELVPLLGQSKRSDGSGKEEELEQTNFFANIYHIQTSRRCKVLIKFTQLLQSQPDIPIIRPSLLSQLFLPICTEILFNGKDHVFINEAVKAISAIACHLGFNAYIALFRRYYSQMTKQPDQQHLLLKLIFAVLDGFNFDISQLKEGLESEEKAIEQADVEIEEEEAEMDDAEVELEKSKGGVDPTAIYKVLIQNVIPDTLKLLAKCPDEEIKHRIPATLVLTRLLRKMPQQLFDSQFSPVLFHTCQLLKSRLPSNRDLVRGHLVKVIQLLGPSYLEPILKNLESALDRGFFRHILAYTTHALLVALAPTLENGAVDNCVVRIVDIVIEDMFGELGKEKDAENYTGKQKEVKESKSHLTFELLASVTSFSLIGKLLQPLKQILSETDNVKVLNKVDLALKKLASGLCNSTRFNTELFLTFCHSLINNNLFAVKSASKPKSNAEITFTVHIKRKRLNGETDYLATNGYKFVELGMNLLLTSLTEKKLTFDNNQSDMLNPFVQVVGESLYSNYQLVVIRALKVATLLATFDLPDLELGLPIMVKRIFHITRQLNTTKDDIVQAGFQLLAKVLILHPNIPVSTLDLKMLIELIRPDLEEPSRQTTTFDMLKAILNRQLIDASLYDLIDDVAKVMITSQIDQVRALCRNVYLTFLSEYPQGEARLQKQIKFLVANLNYRFESGRLSALQTLHSTTDRIPRDMLQDSLEIIFLGLTVALINDDSNLCREASGKLLKSLIKKANDKTFTTIFNLTTKWASVDIVSTSNNPQLRRLGLQVLGFIVESIDTKIDYRRTLQLVTDNLELGWNLVEKSESDFRTQQLDTLNVEFITTLPIHFEIPYYALTTYIKLITKSPKYLDDPNATAVWPITIKLLRHPHAWVRSLSSKLLGTLFSYVDPTTLHFAIPDVKRTKSYKHPNVDVDALVGVCNQLCVQYKMEDFEGDLADQFVKNMFFITKVFTHHKSNSAVVTTKDEEDEMEDDDDVDEAGDKDLLKWLLRKCSYLASSDPIKLDQPVIKRSYLFQLSAALTSTLESEALTPYLEPMLTPLIRTSKDPLLQTHSDHFKQLKQLVHEVDSFIKEKSIKSDYLDVTSKVLQEIQTRRGDRREKLKLRRMQDPEKYNTIKLKLQSKKYKLAKQAKLRKSVAKRKEREARRN